MARRRKSAAKKEPSKKQPPQTRKRLDTALPFSIFGAMTGTVTIRGDHLAPLDVEWNAEKGKLLSDE